MFRFGNIFTISVESKDSGSEYHMILLRAVLAEVISILNYVSLKLKTNRVALTIHRPLAVLSSSIFPLGLKFHKSFS